MTSCWKTRLSDLYSRNPATFRGKTFFGKLQTFLVPLFFEQFFSVFPNLYGRAPQNSGLSARGSFRGETIVVKKKLFISSNCFQIWAKPFGLLATTVRQRCQNCSLCAKGTNWGKQCFEKMFNTLTKIGIQITLFRTFRGKFWQFCKICNLCTRGTFWRKTFVLEKKLISKTFLRLRAKSFRSVC